MTTIAEPIAPAVPALGIHTDLSNADYHADKTSLSSSGARKLLAPSTPAHFRYEQDNPQPATKTFDYGNAAHKLVLGNGPELVVIEHDTWNTKAAKAEVAEARERGAIPLKQHEMDMINGMADAIRNHPLASALLDPAFGAPEQSGFWIDGPTGIRRRVRFDWLPSIQSGRLIIPDYKTAADASDDAMQRDIAKYGYNQQADWYEEAARALGLGGQDAELLLIVQEKKAPFLINVIGIEFGSRIIGGAKNRAAINTFAECMSTGNWPGYGDEPNYLALPGYAENRDKEIYL
ncbi:PD-(D/E)XK nuclease-like domain-containing protein [Streptomyces sp. ME02-7008A-1]|uniref:PD-(D/E)XK nuclease-like domain-containing protein n=1 Tax=unclassified Streptomyces TaxID=2593676 RepID=UPI0029AB30E5|nr:MULTISPECIES: PD-(D/E)XK nuclease-like domain-containing protein [unclassified Streptomyces]MDX3183564.1 PD-(D/E)XK nuclease-like domain-containing protein [Streptomyces sp. ME02-7008A-1]MDX3304016.1 PD-(D/E)XK nuclease-like domain-containing protein [Streptomyces sp. ME02-7008A]